VVPRGKDHGNSEAAAYHVTGVMRMFLLPVKRRILMYKITKAYENRRDDLLQCIML